MDSFGISEEIYYSGENEHRVVIYINLIRPTDMSIGWSRMLLTKWEFTASS